MHERDTVNHCDYPLNEVRSYQWRDIIFVNIGRQAAEFETYASDLIERWQELNQPVYHSEPDSSFSLTVSCNWKLAVKNYCEAYHLPFIHPGLNSYSRLEDHYNIMPVSTPMLVRVQPFMHRKSAMMAVPFQILKACRNNGHQVWNMLRYFQICFLVFIVTIAMALFWCLTGQIAPSNMLKSIIRKTRQQNQPLPICVPPIPPCGVTFLSKMCLLLKACKKAVIPANMMAANSRL